MSAVQLRWIGKNPPDLGGVNIAHHRLADEGHPSNRPPPGSRAQCRSGGPAPPNL